jgi:hypothetical protein
MKREKILQLGVGLSVVTTALLVIILIGLSYYIPRVDQRIAALSTRLNNQNSTAGTNTTETKVADLTPRLESLEKNYTTLVSVINAKMPNVNLPALLTITNAKGTPTANIELAIALIENEPVQGREYLIKSLAFSNDEVTAVMGPMDKYNKKSLFGKMKIFHQSV